MSVILPGATIGFLGGGQLGRMAAMAARTMGYDVHVLDPEANCPARPLASQTITAKWGDADAATRLAEGADVVTIEIEQIPLHSLEAAERHAPLRPGPQVLWIVQDRARQKEWLRDHGFPLGPFAVVHNAAETEAAVRAMGSVIVKSTHGGYDGRGQARVHDVERAAAAWNGIGAPECVAEQFLSLAAELSVMVARSPSGEMRAYPPARNHHTHGVLTWSVIPGGFDEAVVKRATEIACGIAEQLGVVGLIAVELFLLEDGTVCVNELAPRPHNTYHHSERACVTSQFEQLVRAVCGLPLGDTDVVRPAAIYNLLGEVWSGPQPPNIDGVLAQPGVRVHLYGKHQARPGRKMGHLSACGDTPDIALQRVIDGYRLMAAGTDGAIP
ncbi:MAG: 5-(carboxyamino)imidazole ribonucleotide synthase [Gemmatimonadaceae bacterium]|nr:5-(carboxyamino)imidazole ribonucleotide synthase [Gemmatimonadaceae bacterium]